MKLTAKTKKTTKLHILRWLLIFNRNIVDKTIKSLSKREK